MLCQFITTTSLLRYRVFCFDSGYLAFLFSGDFPLLFWEPLSDDGDFERDFERDKR